MDKDKIMMAMSHVDREFIAEAAAGTGASRRPWKRVAIIAACFCLLLTGTVLAAVESGFSIKFFTGSIRDGDIVDGYEVDTQQRVPVDSFSQQVRDLAAALGGEHGFYGFDSMEEAEAFLGLEVMNNPALDAAERVNVRFFLDEATSAPVVAWLGNNYEGKLVVVRTLSGYVLDGVEFEVMSNMVTDLNPYENGGGLGYSFDAQTFANISHEEYTTACGETATIVREDDFAGGVIGYRAYLPVGSAFVEVTAFRAEPVSGETMLATLKQVLDSFA